MTIKYHILEFSEDIVMRMDGLSSLSFVVRLKLILLLFNDKH